MEKPDPEPQRQAKIRIDISDIPETLGENEHRVEYRKEFLKCVRAKSDEPLSFIWLEGDTVCLGIGHSEIEMFRLDFAGKTNVTIGEVLKLAYLIKHHSKPTQEDIVEQFGEPEYKQQLKYNADDARAGFADFPFPDDIPKPDLPEEGDGQEISATLARGRGKANGLVVGITHKDNKSREPMLDMLDDSQCPEIVFIEEIQSGAQELLDYFLSPDCDADEMPRELEDVLLRLDQEYGKDQYGGENLGEFSFLAFVLKAKAKGISVVGLDAPECKTDQSDEAVYGAKRCAAMHNHSMQVIQERLERHPDATFLIATGAAHVNTHIGGVPGFCQLLNIPGITMENGGPPIAAEEIEEFRKFRTDPEMRAIHELHAKYPLPKAHPSLREDDEQQLQRLRQIEADAEFAEKVAEWEHAEFEQSLTESGLSKKQQKILLFIPGVEKHYKKKIRKKKSAERMQRRDNDNNQPAKKDGSKK